MNTYMKIHINLKSTFYLDIDYVLMLTLVICTLNFH